MKKGTTATIKVKLDSVREEVNEIIFTFSNDNKYSEEPPLQKSYPDHGVRYEDGYYLIGLSQTDTNKLAETFYLEAQIIYGDWVTSKSLIKKVKMPRTLFTKMLSQSVSEGEEVDVELETETVTEVVNTDYEDLRNKPQINNITLIGNKTAHDLGLATPSEVESAEQSAKDYADNIALNLGNNLAVSINTQTYVLTFTLKHDNGTLSTASVDLPLESTVVSGRYDKTSKKLILTLVSGEIIEIPLGDLIDGLVSTDDLAEALADYQLKITSSNKLDADLVNDEESENKFTNETEKSKWNAEATVFDAIYNNGQIVRTTSSYPNIKKNDLIIDTDVANNPQTSVKIWRVKFTPSTTLELELLSGIVVIDDTPPTEQYGSSGIYTVDQIVFSKNGNFYRCVTATRGQDNLYTYTWQTYDIKNKTRAYPAVISGGQVSFLGADYPGIKAGDTIYYNTGGASKNKQWIVVYTTTTLQVMDCEEIGFITGTPPTTVQASGTQYIVDKIYFSDNGNIYRCLTKTPNDQITGYDYTWQTFDGHDTKYSAGTGLSLSNGVFNVDNPLPSSSSSDSGKFLRVGASGSPEWQLVANAEDNSY